MVAFIIGMIAGAGVALMIMAFLAVLADEDERKQPPPPDHWRWYMEDDGK